MDGPGGAGASWDEPKKSDGRSWDGWAWAGRNRSGARWDGCSWREERSTGMGWGEARRDDPVP